MLLKIFLQFHHLLDVFLYAIRLFKTLDATKMNKLLETFNEVKREYSEITGIDENKEEKAESIEK